MKSDCCGADAYLDKSVRKGQRCCKCNEPCYTPSRIEISKCCGAPIKDKYGSFRCTECGDPILSDIVIYGIPKLIPEQVKAIWWPTWEDCNLELELIRLNKAENFAHWAIRYALQDLMPKEEK